MLAHAPKLVTIYHYKLVLNIFFFSINQAHLFIQQTCIALNQSKKKDKKTKKH